MGEAQVLAGQAGADRVGIVGAGLDGVDDRLQELRGRRPFAAPHEASGQPQSGPRPPHGRRLAVQDGHEPCLAGVGAAKLQLQLAGANGGRGPPGEGGETGRRIIVDQRRERRHRPLDVAGQQRRFRLEVAALGALLRRRESSGEGRHRGEEGYRCGSHDQRAALGLAAVDPLRTAGACRRSPDRRDRLSHESPWWRLPR
jgi:hypothetical protein